MTIEANWHVAKDIFVAEITASGTGVVEDGVTYYPHAWVERELSTTGRGYGEKAGARTGTVTSHPAFTLDGTALDAGTLVFMRQRGWVNATSISGDVYDIVSVSVVVPGSSGGGGGSGGTGGAFSGASVYLPDTSGLYLPTRFLRRRWDTDGYHRTTAGRDASRLYPPEPGWYMIGGKAANANIAAGTLTVYLVASNRWWPEQSISPGYIVAMQQGNFVEASTPWYFPPGWWGEMYITGSSMTSLIPPADPTPAGGYGNAIGAEFWMYKLGAGSIGPLPLGDAPLGDVPMGGQESPTPADTPSDPAPTPTPSFPSPLDPYQSPPWSPRVDAMGGDMLGDDSMTGGVTRVIFPNEGAAFLDYTGTPPSGSGGGDFSVNTVYVPPPTWEDFISISSVLPGTYRVTAILTATAEISSTAPAWIHMRIYNSTGSAALGNPARIVTCHTANDEYTDCSTLHFDFTISATSTIKLQVKIDDAGHSPTFTTAKILNSGDDVPTYFLRRIFDDE